MKLTIKRSEWSRGVQSANALLVNDDIIDQNEEYASFTSPSPKMGTKCCLGFLCLAIGATEEQIAGKSMPDQIKGDAALRSVLERFNLLNRYLENSEFSERAAEINDSDRNTMEADLIELFKSNNLELGFID